MEMTLRRLTKIEKNEILEDFRYGLSANDLAKKYNCSSNTINRTVKKLLTNEEYHLLKETRSKSKRSKITASKSKESNQEREDLLIDNSALKYSLEQKNDSLEIRDFNNYEDKNDIDSKTKIFDTENNLEEIVPLLTSFAFETQEQNVDCRNLDKVTLPETVYMLVDKKVELESKSISELPEWSFLPETELRRQAILLFPNQRNAKRNCSRSQKVIKIPNTSIFKNYKSYLLAKGITRLIIEDSLISLDN